MANSFSFEKFGLSADLRSLLNFAVEAEALKNVLRRSPLYDFSRRENSAEHSWEVALLAMLFADFADEPVDISRVMRMLLIHDIVEVDAGDTFVYDSSGEATREARERQAADRIFGMLPNGLNRELRTLWEEFEGRSTADARFAAAMDRWQPLLHNYLTQGGTWRAPGVTPQQVYETKRVISTASAELWRVARLLISDGLVSGFFNHGPGGFPILASCEGRYLAVSTFPAGCFPDRWRGVYSAYAQRHGIQFSTLTYFPDAFLRALHEGATGIDTGSIELGSRAKPETTPLLSELTSIANADEQGVDVRRRYLGILLEIYRSLPSMSVAMKADPASIWIAPRREGHLIASCLRGPTAGGTIAPHAKRMMVPGGMLVGLSNLEFPAASEEVTIVDGAIASGATIMAILHALPVGIKRVKVLSAHATKASVACLLKYASGLAIDLQLAIGHVSGILNEKYYAVEPGETSRVVVGDLGDLTAGTE